MGEGVGNLLGVPDGLGVALVPEAQERRRGGGPAQQPRPQLPPTPALLCQQKVELGPHLPLHHGAQAGFGVLWPYLPTSPLPSTPLP